MCRVIRKVTVVRGGAHVVEAAVTMQFPASVELHDCVMMLEICESEVESLVKELFGIIMTSVGGVPHLSLGKGVNVTSCSEITLKGVRGDAVTRILGPEIYEAMTASTMRKRELEEHSIHATACVSMLLNCEPGGRAFLNMCLELEGGTHIRDKLYG